VFLITFSKAGQEDIVLTEDDLFDFQYEASCYSGETFELGGVNAKTLYLLIDNNTQRFSRGTFANCRVKLEINGKEKYTAFFDFSGHVRTFSIRIYSGKWSQGKDPLFNLSLQNKDGQQWRNWDNAHAMSGDSILSFLTTLL